MKHRHLAVAAALACTSLVALGASAFQGGVTAYKHTLNNCEVEVSVTPINGFFTVNAYHEFKNNNPTTAEASVTFSPPKAASVAMGGWLAEPASFVQFEKFSENKALFSYNKTTNVLTLTLSNGTAAGSVTKTFANYHYRGDFHPLEPMKVTLEQLVPIDALHKRMRVRVEVFGLRTGFTLVDL